MISKLIKKLPIEYVVMAVMGVVAFLVVYYIVTLPRGWEKEFHGILYDVYDENIEKKVTIKLKGKYKRNPLNGEGTFIGNIYINGTSIYPDDATGGQKKLRVSGGTLHIRNDAKYYDDTTGKDLYIFLLAYIDDRSKLYIRLYERVSSEHVTFSNRIIASPASNREEALEVQFGVGDEGYIRVFGKE